MSTITVGGVEGASPFWSRCRLAQGLWCASSLTLNAVDMDGDGAPTLLNTPYEQMHASATAACRPKQKTKQSQGRMAISDDDGRYSQNSERRVANLQTQMFLVSERQVEEEQPEGWISKMRDLQLRRQNVIGGTGVPV